MKNYVSSFLIIFILFGMLTWTVYSTASAQTMNIAALGDSITYGIGDPSKKGYIIRVKNELEEKTGISVQVNNFGIPKYTTENVLTQLKNRNIRKQLRNANYIILYIGTNDFRKSTGYKFAVLNKLNINRGKLEFSTNLNKIMQVIRYENSDAAIIVLGLYHPYTEFKNQLEILHVIQEWNSEIQKVIGRYDQTFYVSTLDLFANKPKSKYFSDSLHPNSSGYKLIADRVSKKLYILNN